MSSRLFKNVIYQMKDVIDREFGVIDARGLIVACSDSSKDGEQMEQVPVNFQDDIKPVFFNGYTYQPIGKSNKTDYLVFVAGEDDMAEKYCSLVSISLTNIKQYYDEKYDKGNFIKNIILDNILPGDVSIKAKELHLHPNVGRVVFLIRIDESNNFFVHDIIQNMFPAKNKDFIIAIDEHNIVLVKEMKGENQQKEIDKISKTIVDTMNTEGLIRVRVGIGTVVHNINELAKSYKEAQVALEVGKVFDTEKYIISYDNLGIGRLIYQLPTTLCELFLAEVFKKQSIDALDNETIVTIQKFFENNLNVSETSRQLYVHRNTLVYRLDKIQKLTGLDLRTFDHAIIFKVAMMVKKYLDSSPMKI